MYLVQIWIFGAQTTFNLWTILYQIGHSDWMGLLVYFVAPNQFTTILHMSEMWQFKVGFPNKNTHTMYVRHYKVIRTQIHHLWQKKIIWLLSMKITFIGYFSSIKPRSDQDIVKNAPILFKSPVWLDNLILIHAILIS